MIGYGVIPSAPSVPVFEDNGLTYITQSFKNDLEQGLRSSVLQLKWMNHTIGARAIPSIPEPGQTAWDTLEGWKELGYVVLVEKKSPTDFLISKSVQDIANFTRPGSSHAIVMGSEKLLQASSVAKLETNSSWLTPAFIVGGVILGFVMLRK